ncbi:hypothetical protein FJU08_18520 [Martelella alba]|uniref:Uncharacterized protein n=1 Tax=Martelella alba TaxID=2590451 RepID=A0A506U3L4_9HYPH|nr:hypothetical protein [Martelella alba]TPW28038.1 hypothetical protein FJU08_18520 [Martelella alba]
MFEKVSTPSDLLERLRPSRPQSVQDVVRDEVNALALTARKHPAASGSALALVGLVAFGVGFLSGRVCEQAHTPKRRIFRRRPSPRERFSEAASRFAKKYR